MDLKSQFKAVLPNSFYLDHDIASLEGYLKEQGFLADSELILDLSKPGEGNMNFVLRVKTNQRSFIAKQSRPFVQKYPQIDAPVERIELEALFLQTVSGIETISNYSPAVLLFDKANYMLLLEDLGQGADYSYLYQKNAVLKPEEASELIEYLNVLHHWQLKDELTPFPANMPMRQLNHEHIFNFPFVVDNGLNLDDIQPGLQEIAMIYKTDESLKSKIHTVGNNYLTGGTSLLHGDYYPGSWLKVEQGLKIIDPEFGFMGPPEFDLSVFLAHMMMAEQAEETIQFILSEYKASKGFDAALMIRLCGIEIMRRLIGIAQLPLSLNLKEKLTLMERAAKMIRKGALG